jgi:hypothetical protein
MASKAKDHRDVVWFRQLCHAQVRQMAQLFGNDEKVLHARSKKLHRRL